MIDYDLERARQAVAYLVESSYFKHHLRRLRTVVEKPRALPFKDDAEVLNELLLIGRQNLKAMENLIEIAEFKRKHQGSYQQQFMAQRRARDRRVIEMEELLAGRKLSLDERHQILLQQHQRWNAEKDAFLAKHAEVSWLERNALLKDFWARKDSELSEIIEEARAVLDKTVTRKRVVKVERDPKTVLGTKLKEAMQKKPRIVLDKRR